MSKDKFYITTPIYYPSDKLHIGHSYCTVATDTMARYKRMRGFDVKFLTGTDEHGQKIERIAKEKGVSPKEYVDSIVLWVKKLWKTLDISYDYYIRTTDEIHVKAVQKIFKEPFCRQQLSCFLKNVGFLLKSGKAQPQNRIYHNQRKHRAKKVICARTDLLIFLHFR